MPYTRLVESFIKTASDLFTEKAANFPGNLPLYLMKFFMRYIFYIDIHH